MGTYAPPAFNMAMMAAEKSDNMDAIKQGLEMILKEYKKGLDGGPTRKQV